LEHPPTIRRYQLSISMTHSSKQVYSGFCTFIKLIIIHNWRNLTKNLGRSLTCHFGMSPAGCWSSALTRYVSEQIHATSAADELRTQIQSK